jgi:hypothetical protein
MNSSKGINNGLIKVSNEGKEDTTQNPGISGRE